MQHNTHYIRSLHRCILALSSLLHTLLHGHLSPSTLTLGMLLCVLYMAPHGPTWCHSAYAASMMKLQRPGCIGLHVQAGTVL